MIDLAKEAEKIPSMGGRQIGQHIREAVFAAPDNTAIVELGTWMGAGTAQAALAVMESGKSMPIYTYDRFIVSGRQPMKAAREGVDLEPGTSNYELVSGMLSVFPVPITVIRKEIRKAEYHGGPIGLYIDDACKQESNFLQTQRIFWRHFIPGVTICIFMDFYLWKKTGDEKHKFQYNFITARPEQFKYLKDIEETYGGEEEFGAVFLYLGGKG
jgi:hypothetical protein